jgi:hypothetical protein
MKGKTLGFLLSEKAAIFVQRIRECRTHTTTHEAKERENRKSV